MMNNTINEAIILIASVMSLVVILNAESSLDSHFSIKSGVAFMVVADVLFSVLSASPVGLNIAIIVLAILAVKFRKVSTAAITLLTFIIGAWLVQAIRLLSHATGFKLGQYRTRRRSSQQPSLRWLQTLLSVADIRRLIVLRKNPRTKTRMNPKTKAKIRVALKKAQQP